MLGIVLAEHEIHQMIVLIHDGERIQLVIPNNIVGLLEGGAQRRGHQLLAGGHEGGDLLIAAHAGNAVVTTGDDTQQLTIGLGILGDGHGGEAKLLLLPYNLFLVI